MNIPNIPDNLHKTLFLIGLICIGFAYYKYNENLISLEKYAEKTNDLADESYFQKNKVIDLEYKFSILCWEESQRLGIENFCEKDKNGILDFYRTLNGTKEQKIVSDSLLVFWNEILHERNIRDNLIDKVEFAVDDLKFLAEITDESNEFNIAFGICGGLIMLIGLVRWLKIENIHDQILASQIPKKSEYQFCQSCGRNFSFRVHHGINIDDSKSNLFCGDCFINGRFTDFVDKDSIEHKKEELLKNCTDKKKRRYLSERFDNLERWNQSDYE